MRADARMSDPAELAIRLRRMAFNRALADADLNGIGPLLAANAILVTGTDSAVLSSRKAQMLAWKRAFAATPRTVYIRTPGDIIVSPVEPIAMEQGHWQGVAAGTERTSGTYVAKWRRSASDWVVEAEIYITLA